MRATASTPTPLQAEMGVEGEKDYRKPQGHGNGGQLWKQETALCRWAHQGTQHVLRNIATILRNPYGKCRLPCRRADGQEHEEGSLIKKQGGFIPTHSQV